ncbi:hypothetical protein [Desulfovibrio sp. SGI.169]|uniref:hypothetical protein n=1 Tax=Desulfovibrio sp. SGI.169 TaxID=3420561 RepID=UPI003D063EEB
MPEKSGTLPEPVRFSLDTLIAISNSYSTVASQELAKTPEDESLRALAAFSENTEYYLKILKKMIAYFGEIQSLTSSYQLMKARIEHPLKQ